MLASVVCLCILAVASAQQNTFINQPQNAFAPNTFAQNTPQTFPAQPPQVQTNFYGNYAQCTPQQLRQGEEVPLEYLQAHHRFTSDLLKHQGYWGRLDENGVAFTNSFTLGHFLAVLSQEIFDIPTSTVAKVLRLPSNDKVVDSYAQQFHVYEQDDNKVYATSYLFTPLDNLRVTPAIERLFTRKQILTLFKNPSASAHINELIRVATRDNIDNDIVPEVPPFTEQTTGVFVNTFQYASDWKHTLTKVGKHPFNTPNGVVPVEAYEFNGAFPVLETTTYTAVAVPLEGDSKHVVFVQPKTTLRDYFANGNVDEIFTNGPNVWPKKNVRVQIPHVNVTLAHGFSQLNEERLQCVTEQGPRPHVLQLIVQAVSFAITDKEVVYSVANGAQVNLAGNNRIGNFRPLSQQRPFTNTPFTNTPFRNTLRPNNDQFYNAQSYTSAEIVFDRPFFVYLHDVSVGPFAFNAISSYFHGEEFNQRQARHHDNPQDFTEETKLHRWNCHQ